MAKPRAALPRESCCFLKKSAGRPRTGPGRSGIIGMLRGERMSVSLACFSWCEGVVGRPALVGSPHRWLCQKAPSLGAAPTVHGREFTTRPVPAPRGGEAVDPAKESGTDTGAKVRCDFACGAGHVATPNGITPLWQGSRRGDAWEADSGSRTRPVHLQMLVKGLHLGQGSHVRTASCRIARETCVP